MTGLRQSRCLSLFAALHARRLTGGSQGYNRGRRGMYAKTPGSISQIIVHVSYLSNFHVVITISTYR